MFSFLINSYLVIMILFCGYIQIENVRLEKSSFQVIKSTFRHDHLQLTLGTYLFIIYTNNTAWETCEDSPALVIVLSAKICFQQQTIHKFDPLTLFSFN